MTVIDKKECRKAEVIEIEIEALGNLIDRRHAWMNKAENKMRRTYDAIVKDTLEMECKLLELNKELEESNQN